MKKIKPNHTLWLLLTMLLVIGKQTTNATPKPVDISYCIADLKFNGKTLKVCELGLCTWSCYKGHDQLYGEGSIWKAIWSHLNQFNIPVWFVGRRLLSDSHRKEVAIDAFIANGGTVVDSLKKLSFTLNAKKKNKYLEAPSLGDPYDISSYKGIVVMVNRYHQETKATIELFKKEHPQMIILDSYAAPYVNNKAATNRLFEQAGLNHFKPNWRIFEKRYSPAYVKSIISEFNHHTYVIKPLNSSEGCGIIIVKQEQLDETLKKIFTDIKKVKVMSDTSYRYWAYDPHHEFILEAYEPSKPITVDHRRYDGTMRVVFALMLNRKTITVDFLGSYWKLPQRSLDEDGSLNDKHKSKISTCRQSSTEVTTEDNVLVQEIFHQALPMLYEQMIPEIEALGMSEGFYFL